jgi:hypothetical protein
MRAGLRQVTQLAARGQSVARQPRRPDALQLVAGLVAPLYLGAGQAPRLLRHAEAGEGVLAAAIGPTAHQQAGPFQAV